MDCNNAIMAALIGGVCLLLSPFVGYFVFRLRTKHEARSAARSQAIEAFVPELLLLAPAIDDVGKHIDWYNYLLKMVSRHQAAILKIKPFLLPDKCEALESDWKTYNTCIQCIPSWINQDGFYKDDEKTTKARKEAYVKLCDIVKIIGG